jgi:hypothetical protein
MPHVDDKLSTGWCRALIVALAVIVAGCDSKKPDLPATPQIPIETLSGFPDNADLNDGPFTLITREPADRSAAREMQMLYRGSPISHMSPSTEGARPKPLPLTFTRRVHNGPAAYVLSYDCKAIDLVTEAGEHPTVTTLQGAYDALLEADLGGQDSCAGLRLSMNELAFPGTLTIDEKRNGTMFHRTEHEVNVLGTDTLDIQTYRRPDHDILACVAGSAKECEATKTKGVESSANDANVSVTVVVNARAIDAWDRLLFVGHSPDARFAAWITPPAGVTTDDAPARTLIVADATGEHPRKIAIPDSLQTRLTTATERTRAQYPMTPAWLATAFVWQNDSRGEWTLAPRDTMQAVAPQGLQAVAGEVEAVLVDPASIDSLTLATQLQDSMGGQDAARGADGQVIPARPWPPQVFGLTAPGLTPFSIVQDKTARRDGANRPDPRFLVGISTRENGGEPGGSLVLTFAGDTPSLDDEGGIASLRDRLDAWLKGRHAPCLWAKPSELKKSAALAQRLRAQLGWREPQIADALATLHSEPVAGSLEEKGWLLFTAAGAFLLHTTSVGIPNAGLAWDLWAVYRLPSPARTAFSEQIRNAVRFPAYGEYLTASLPAWLRSGQVLDDTADKDHLPDGYLLRRPVDLSGMSILSIHPDGEGYAMRVDGTPKTTIAALEAMLQVEKTRYVVLSAEEREPKAETVTRLREQLGWSQRRIEDWTNKWAAGTDRDVGAQLITNHGVVTVSSIRTTEDFAIPASLVTTSRGTYPGHPD